MARLMIVDDDEPTLAWMIAALASLGHEVRGFARGQDALASTTTWQPDLIVTDILMPELDGLAFTRLARKLRKVPVVCVSIAGLEADAVLSGAGGFVQKPATAAEVRAAVERVMGRDAEHNTILVVDDDADIRELYRSFLEPRFGVLDAAHGREALDVLRTRAVDLAVVDVHMPVMNGVELIRAMRADPTLARVPVIVQTSDQSALDAPVWRELHVSQTVGKGEFLRWLNDRIEARAPSAPRRAG